MAQSSVQSFYKFHAYIYDLTRWAILHGRRGAAHQMGLRRSSKVLEIGCGTGLNFRFVQEHLDLERSRLVGVDFSADMLAQAEKRVRRQGWKNVELIEADAAQLALDETFDSVLCAYSITMIPDWQGSLERAWAHVAPGGRLVVLDFSTFDRWGPMGPVMRTWLKLNHVQTRRPYLDGLRALPGGVCEVSTWLGSYNFTAVVTRPNSTA